MNILKQLEEIIKIAEETFSYETVFDLTGISSMLEDYFITTDILNEEYISIFFNTIKKFKKDNNLYKQLSLNDEKDLVFLGEVEEFVEAIKETISIIKKKLEPREKEILEILEYLKKFDSKNALVGDIAVLYTKDLKKYKDKSLKELKKVTDKDISLKRNKATVLFILDNLKEKKAIYAYNGKEVSLN